MKRWLVILLVGVIAVGVLCSGITLIYAQEKEEPSPPKVGKLIDDEQIENLKGAISNDLEVAGMLAEQAENLATEAVTPPVDLDKLERAGDLALVSARIIHETGAWHWLSWTGFEKLVPSPELMPGFNFEELMEQYSKSASELESQAEEAISELKEEDQAELSARYEELKSELSSEYEDLLSGLESKRQELAAELGESPELKTKYEELKSKLRSKCQALLSRLESEYEELKSSPSSESEGPPWRRWW